MMTLVLTFRNQAKTSPACKRATASMLVQGPDGWLPREIEADYLSDLKNSIHVQEAAGVGHSGSCIWQTRTAEAAGEATKLAAGVMQLVRFDVACFCLVLAVIAVTPRAANPGCHDTAFNSNTWLSRSSENVPD
jgi:hypothetical protein